MPHVIKRWAALAAIACCALPWCGCTSVRDYVRNGFKVGPQYATPPAPIANHWIDDNDMRVRSEPGDISSWWSVFDDPMLNNVVVDAYQQNLTLREAGFRILAARAQYGIAVGTFFPQQQNMAGGYTRQAFQNLYSENWNLGFNLAWELDFWGRFRRAILAAEANLDASVFNYDDVLVTLVGDVASAYVQIRTTQRRIQLLENVIAVQQDVYNFIDQRLAQGFRGVTDLDKAQAESDLKQSRPRWRSSGSNCGKPRTACAHCWDVRRWTWSRGSPRPPKPASPSHQTTWSPASRPSCCAAVRTFAAPNDWPRRRQSRSASPPATYIRHSRSLVRWVFRTLSSIS